MKMSTYALFAIALFGSACSGYKKPLNETHLGLAEAGLPASYAAIDTNPQSKTVGQQVGALELQERADKLIVVALTATDPNQAPNRFLGHLLSINGTKYFEVFCEQNDVTSDRCPANQPVIYSLASIQQVSQGAQDYTVSLFNLKTVNGDPLVGKVGNSFVLDNSGLTTVQVLNRMEASPLQANFRAK